MKNKKGFFYKFFTSIYDLNVFSQYAKEGLFRAILYAAVLVFLLGGLKTGTALYGLNKKIIQITTELKGPDYNIDIQDGKLKIDKPVSVFDENGVLVYINQDISITNIDNIRNKIANSDMYGLFLKDGIIINDGINIYNVSYRSIFKDNISLESQLDTIRLTIVLLLFVFKIIIIFLNFLIDWLLVSLIAGVIALFMRMMVKYNALYALTIYAATLPLIIETILGIINPNIDFELVFIAGTLTYLILILKYIKADIIENIKQKRMKN